MCIFRGRWCELKPAPFEYIDPLQMSEVLEALAQYGDEGKILAGGQSLVPLLNMRLAQPRVLIDLNRVSGLDCISPRQVGGVAGVGIGAMSRQRAIEEGNDMLAGVPLLGEAISWVGHRQIRNRGTVGGSVVHADPAAELPLVFRALDGVATVQSSRGRRTVPASDFFVFTFTPDLEPDEMLTEIWLPVAEGRTGQAFLEVARRHGDFALVAVAVTLTLDTNNACSHVAIAVGGAAPIPVRATVAEDALCGRRVTGGVFREVGRLAADALEPSGDVHADAEYRRDVAATLMERALQTAFQRATKGDA